MKLWLLSHLRDSPGNRLIMSAAERAGHAVTLVHPQRLTVHLPGKPGQQPTLFTPDATCELPDLVFTRMGSSAPPDGFDALRQLEAISVLCINSSTSLAISRDKARTFQVLARNGIPLPQTVLVGREAGVHRAIDVLGDPPWIVKLPVSAQGMGVARVDSVESLHSVTDMLLGLQQRVIIQHYVEEARGTDIRILVVGGKSVAAMRRRARADDIRSNLHRGGTSENVEILPEWSKIAEAAARATGLQVAGVDLLPGRHGPLVCEVNGSPGLQGLENATRRDLASDIVTFLGTQAEKAADSA